MIPQVLMHRSTLMLLDLGIVLIMHLQLVLQ